MQQPPRTLLVFVDGIGIGSGDPAINPVLRGSAPNLLSFLKDGAVPVDASLGVAGLPQSATGQASLLTGCNAAELMGRHVEGLPGPRLKKLVRQQNLFSQLATRGYSCTFANAYFIDDVEDVRTRRHQSVSTVASLAAFGGVRDSAALLRNDAVYQDLTRASLRQRGYAGPTITPREAGEHLLAIADGHDFTMFEYFQTDLVAHKGTADDVQRILSQLDEFLGVVAGFGKKLGGLFVLTSDHGNIEDSRTRLHTNNRVPFVAIGQGAERLKESLKSLTDFVPAMLELYPQRKPQACHAKAG